MGVLAVLAPNVSSGPTGVTVEIDRDTLFGFGRGETGTVRTRFPVKVTPIGGQPAYTYNYVYVSGDTGVVVETQGTNTTYFSYFFDAPFFITAIFKCTVTDSNATVVDSQNITVNLSLTASDLYL